MFQDSLPDTKSLMYMDSWKVTFGLPGFVSWKESMKFSKCMDVLSRKQPTLVWKCIFPSNFLTCVAERSIGTTHSRVLTGSTRT